MSLANTGLINLKPPAEYQSGRLHVFPSDTSIQWYLRQNRAELIKAGALLKINGRVMVDEVAFDSFVVALGQAAANQVDA